MCNIVHLGLRNFIALCRGIGSAKTLPGLGSILMNNAAQKAFSLTCSGNAFFLPPENISGNNKYWCYLIYLQDTLQKYSSGVKFF